MRIAILLLLAGCASTGTHAEPAAPPQQPLMTTAGGEVKLGDWCNLLSVEMCDAMTRACFSGNESVKAGCIDQAKVSCLADRDPQIGAGRRPADLNTCVTKLRGLNCEGLGAGIGSGALEICQARAAVPPPGAAPIDQ
jgi:hypothetical protein